MQENSLHASLKSIYSKPGSIQEAFVDGYFIDVLTDGLLIEIQTRNFSAIKSKLVSLLESYTVRLVYPIALEKWIVRQPLHGGKSISRRKSPKRGRIEDIFNELVYIGHVLPHQSFQFEVIFIFEEEIRRDDGKGSWRRKGISIFDRRMLKFVERRLLIFPDDYIALIPQDLISPFSNYQLAQSLGIRYALARKMTYCLRQSGSLSVVGKQGNALLLEVDKNI